MITEGARGEGATLTNSEGDGMERYAPTVKDLAPRDMVSRAMTIEIREGRGVGPRRTTIFLHLAHLDPKVLARAAAGDLRDGEDLRRRRRHQGADPVLPTVHYNMAASRRTWYGEAVTLNGDNPDRHHPGLMAVGEAACVSVHRRQSLGSTP